LQLKKTGQTDFPQRRVLPLRTILERALEQVLGQALEQLLESEQEQVELEQNFRLG
jgi:hypothetical protein